MLQFIIIIVVCCVSSALIFLLLNEEENRDYSFSFKHTRIFNTRLQYRTLIVQASYGKQKLVIIFLSSRAFYFGKQWILCLVFVQNNKQKFGQSQNVHQRVYFENNRQNFFSHLKLVKSENSRFFDACFFVKIRSKNSTIFQNKKLQMTRSK